MLIVILYTLLLCAIIKGIGQVIGLAVKLATLILVAVGRILSLLVGRKGFVRV